MKIFVICCYLFCLFISSCYYDFSFDSDKINKITIRNFKTNKFCTVDNKEIINVLINNYINTNKKYFAIFMGINHITFNYKGKETLLITNGEYIKYNGVAYKLAKNIDTYIEELN